MQQATSQSTVIAAPSPHPGRLLDEVRNERFMLTGQLDALRREHRDLRVELTRIPQSPERTIRAERIGELDQQIQMLEKQLEVNTAEMRDAVPQTATVVEVPPPFPGEPHLIDLPDEYVFLGALFMLVTLLPLSVAFARRMWHRSTPVRAELPTDLAERMNRVENIVEATALEVERIGEGQRFMTTLMNENLGVSRNVTAGPPRAANARDRSAQRDALQGGDSPLPGMITPV